MDVWLLALRAIHIVAIEPLADAATIENLFAIAALNGLLGYVMANLTDKWVDEFALGLDRIITGQFVPACLLDHEVYYVFLHLSYEPNSVRVMILLEPWLLPNRHPRSRRRALPRYG